MIIRHPGLKMSSDSLAMKTSEYVGKGASWHHQPGFAGHVSSVLKFKDKINTGSMREQKLVGGLVDGTSGTIKVPYMDIIMQWTLGDNIMRNCWWSLLTEGRVDFVTFRSGMGRRRSSSA